MITKGFRKIEIWERINRDDVRLNRNKIFLFGDNLAEKGFGGQAREMRGEENSIGIPTKKAPSNYPASFFTDKEFDANIISIDKAFQKIPTDKTLVIPKAGIGTGLARLSQAAPKTFKYLNQKFAEIGFDNLRGGLTESKNVRVLVQKTGSESVNEKRLLDLGNIQTGNLRILSPTNSEVSALNIDRRTALADYADRLRNDYKENREDFRGGIKLLSDSLERGDQITITCPCHNGEMCHADVVKMAIERVNLYVESRITAEIGNLTQDTHRKTIRNAEPSSLNQRTPINPRTQRAINDILSFSENDQLLGQIDKTNGRNRSEQASYLGRHSQFVRDAYERGATIKGGNLIIPQENLGAESPLFITTQQYAIKKIGNLLKDEKQAKEIAPVVVEYGNQISGSTADGETKLKVFNWIYESLEGKGDLLKHEDPKSLTPSQRFEETLKQIRTLAEEMRQLEPSDKLELVPLNDFGQTKDLKHSSIDLPVEVPNFETRESEPQINTESFERIELTGNIPRIPDEFSEQQISRLFTHTLPEIDRKLEHGIPAKEIIKPFNEMIWQSTKDDTLNQLERIYQKQKLAEFDRKLSNAFVHDKEALNMSDDKSRIEIAILTPTQEFIREKLWESKNQSKIKKTKFADSPKPQTIAQFSGVDKNLSRDTIKQLDKIDVLRPNTIELTSPGEYALADKMAINIFFRQKKLEIGNLLEKFEGTQALPADSTERTKTDSIRKELRKVERSNPSFSYKLRGSTESVTGVPSVTLIQERNFVSSYIDYQLKQPDIRLRNSNYRYRIYAAKLQSAANRNEVMLVSSEIRAENARIGLKWKELEESAKKAQPRPLTQKEMQFLFTENSPSHYTREMTALKFSYAHAGESRRNLTRSLIKGEISPSQEAQKLIDSLESRLHRRELNSAISATRHFFQSLKSTNDTLKYKNAFDHRDLYRKLPPQEKDFIYFKAIWQKENLEYRLVCVKNRLFRTSEANHDAALKLDVSDTEKSFYLKSQFNQARILGESIETPAPIQKEIRQRDISGVAILLKNQSVENLDLFAQEFEQSENIEYKKIGEVLKTFGRPEVTKDKENILVSIKLPEDRLVEVETYRELLDEFYPDVGQNKYEISHHNEKTINAAREKGQDESIRDMRHEVEGTVYQNNVLADVFSTERSIVENLDKIARLQQTARNAKRENENILEKYSRRAIAKIKNQDKTLPSSIDQKELVSRAMGGKENPLISNKLNDRFFNAVQKEITISDFQKFSANEKFIAETKVQINSGFAEITRDKDVLEESILRFSGLPQRDETLQQTYTRIQQFQENRLLTVSAREAFTNGSDVTGKTILDFTDTVETNKIKLKSFTQARLALEPDINSFEAKGQKEQGLKLVDSIEHAHELSKNKSPVDEISRAFDIAEREKTALFEAAISSRSQEKPLSLQLFESEINRSEKQLLAKSFGEKLLDRNDFLESEKLPDLDTLFTSEEREEIKIEAIEIAKDRLAPKELDNNHLTVTTETSQQALATFKQLENAAADLKTSNNKSKINDSFLKLDRESAKLHQNRQDDNHSEKLTLLRDGIKSDIAELLKTNPNLKDDVLVDQTTRILNHNLDKISLNFVHSSKNSVILLSKEISLAIEAKQNYLLKDNSVLNYSQNVINPLSKNSQPYKTKENIVRTKDSINYHR